MRGGPVPKPTPRPKRSGHRDPVTPDLHRRIRQRDGGCVAAVLDDRHVCRDAFGNRHRWDALDLLTVDHVKDEPRMGVRAPSDPEHLVAMCHWGNLYWASSHRTPLREYLKSVT